MMRRVINKIGRIENGSPRNAAFSTMFTEVSARVRTQAALYTLRTVIGVTDTSETAFRNDSNACVMEWIVSLSNYPIKQR